MDPGTLKRPATAPEVEEMLERLQRSGYAPARDDHQLALGEGFKDEFCLVCNSTLLACQRYCPGFGRPDCPLENGKTLFGWWNDNPLSKGPE